MAATPQYGSMTFVGLRSGRTYTKDVYLSDVANALVRWDAGQGAGAATPTEWICPEPVALVDYAQVTGTQDTTKLQLTVNGIPTGDILRYVPHLTTNSKRPSLLLKIATYARIGALQLA